MRFSYKIVRFITWCFFKLCYHHQTYGVEHCCLGRALIAPNHASYLDPPLIGASCPEEIHYLARQSLFKNPLLCFLIRNLNAHPINRKSQDLGAFKQINKLLLEDKKVVIFPEGERSLDGSLQKVKPGIGLLALQAKSAVIPVYLHGTYEVWSRKRKFPKLWGSTACVFGSPILWETFAHLDKKEAQQALALEVEKALLNLQKWYLQGAHGTPP